MSDLIERLNGWADDLRKSGEVAMRRPDREGASPRVAGLASRADLLTEAADELTRLRSLVDQSGGGVVKEDLVRLIASWPAHPGDLGPDNEVICDRLTPDDWQDIGEAPATIDRLAEAILAALASPPHGGRTDHIADAGKMIPDDHGGRILEGWRMVPVEPDVKMIAAWYQVKNTGSVEPGEWGEDRSDYAAYRAMLSAAPVSPLREEAR